MDQTRDHDNMKSYINNFFEGIINLFIFFPYFFSIGPISRTLFSPWKKITTTRKRRGFSLGAWASDILFDLISRGIGFSMRMSLILFYVLLQGMYLLLIPFILVYLVLSIPMAFVIFAVTESEANRRLRLKEQFVAAHQLTANSKQMVEKWFDYLYDIMIKPHHWWKISELMKIPPLARDWAVGFTPTLDAYAENLTDPTYQQHIRSHIIGRESEVAMIERVLSKSDESNAVLVGEEGVGKHTILEAFAQKIYEGKTTSLLSYKRLMKLDMERILSEHPDSSAREVFLDELLKEATTSGSVIIMIDNLERYVSTGENHTDLSSVLEKYASTEKIQIIGITTPFAYQTFIYSNTKISAIFSKIDVEEISKDKALYILMDKAMIFENRYHVTIPYESLLAIIDKSNFFITNIPFPEKALQLLDNVCVYTVQTLKKNVVLPDTVDIVLTNRTHIPTTLTDQIKTKLLHLEELIKTRIFGQDEALGEISSAMRRSFLLIGKRKKPLSSFLFLGPTGVGKTETAKVISEVFFGTSEQLVRFDMSLYQTKEDIHKLLGSIELLNPGLLTNAIREHPYGVLLLDEIEKAHPDLLNIFLTILDEGYFTDGYGQRVDCKNLVIVATSNAGSAHIHQILLKQSMTALKSEEYSSNSLIDYLVEQHLFSPEFLNRFDGVIAFKPLEEETAQNLAKDMVAEIKQTIYDMYKIHIDVSAETIQKLTSQGYDKQYGARNLDRVMRQQLEDKIAKQILAGSAKEGDTIHL